MKQKNDQPTTSQPQVTHTTTRPAISGWGIGIPIAIALIAIVVLLISALSPETELDSVKLANKIKFAEVWGVTWRWLSQIVVVGACSIILAFGIVAVIQSWKWLSEYRERMYPKEGLFPVIRQQHGRTLVFHDANRAPTATTVYANGVPTYHTSTDEIPAGQLMATQGALLAQIASGSPDQGTANKVVEKAIPAVTSHRPALLGPPMPEVDIIEEPGHIARLVQEQGELPPIMRRVGE